MRRDGLHLGKIGVAFLMTGVLGVGSPGCSKKEPQAKRRDAPVKVMDAGRTEPLGGPVRTAPLPRRAAPEPGPVMGTSRELYQRARAAWLAGKCTDAIRIAQQAFRQEPLVRHVSIIGACACSQRDESLAKWAYARLTGGHRNMLKAICRSKGIDLEGTADAMDAMHPMESMEPMVPMLPMEPMVPDTATGLYHLARTAWLSGQCAKAIRLANKANQKKHHSRHWSIIGACACSLRRRPLALKAYRVLRGGHRYMLVQICRNKGIQLK